MPSKITSFVPPDHSHSTVAVGPNANVVDDYNWLGNQVDLVANNNKVSCVSRFHVSLF